MQKGYILIAVLLLGLASANFWQVTKEFKSDSFNASVLDSWTVEGFNQPFVSNCQKTFVGGPGIAAKSSILKVFETPFELSEINIEVDIGLFDNWATGWEGGKNQNQVAIFVNDVNVYQIGSDETRQLHSQGTNFCGGNARDRWTKASFTVPVTGKQFVVKFVGVFADGSDPNHSSWGIRELYILASVGKSNAVLLVDELNDVNFNSEVWSATNVGNNKFSQCGGKSILGGYTATAGATFVRSISAIPPHSFLTIELDAYFLDSLDRNDSVVFSVDGKIVLETSKTYHDATTNICGLDRVNDLIKHLKIQVPHFSSTAEVKIYVNCDQGVGDESFGFNNFQVTASLPCPIIYSENNQRGKLLSFCGDIPNLLEIGWTYPIKGIYVPEGYKLTVFENSKYSGKRYSVTQSNFNLSGNDYVLINKAFKVQRY